MNGCDYNHLITEREHAVYARDHYTLRAVS